MRGRSSAGGSRVLSAWWLFKAESTSASVLGRVRRFLDALMIFMNSGLSTPGRQNLLGCWAVGTGLASFMEVQM